MGDFTHSSVLYMHADTHAPPSICSEINSSEAKYKIFENPFWAKQRLIFETQILFNFYCWLPKSYFSYFINYFYCFKHSIEITWHFSVCACSYTWWPWGRHLVSEFLLKFDNSKYYFKTFFTIFFYFLCISLDKDSTLCNVCFFFFFHNCNYYFTFWLFLFFF